jgi:Cu+-exporting ATPase
MIGTPQDMKIICFHCGDACADTSIRVEEKVFCCDGCKTVHELLAENNLCTYYELENNPGISIKAKPFKSKFAYLDDAQVVNQLLSFTDGKTTHVTFSLPQIHCASCVWLLEHLYKLNQGITYSRVDFVQKQITVHFENAQTSMRKVVETLAMVGYEPTLHLNDISTKQVKVVDRTRIYKLTVAGFCFANIMMLSFPEYFGLGTATDEEMKSLFSFLNLGLAMPTLLYSASEFFVSTWKSMRAKFLHIDAPIALAIAVTFGRSLYEILTGTGAGYLDSMTGIIFFMLVGRYFQDRTHSTISFERDYKSFFPISVTVKKGDAEEIIAISALRTGDRVIVRSGEIIPADAKLLEGEAAIDYSFVNGESQAVNIPLGNMIYAGGKQTAGTITVEIMKPVAQSYLTHLWNKDIFQEEKKEQESFIHAVSKYFTYVLFTIAAISVAYWYPISPVKALDALTAILIVACPCALLLSATYTNGNALRILARNHFFVKNAAAMETIGKANHIVFDKTGTITRSRLKEVVFNGELTEREQEIIAAIASQSSHPLSRSIAQFLNISSAVKTTSYKEESGRGITAKLEDGTVVMLGSAALVGQSANSNQVAPTVWVKINNTVKGHFSFKTEYREDLDIVLETLKKEEKSLSLISGDNESEARAMREKFGIEAELRFNQSPEDKLEFISNIQAKGHTVIMVGDGLNDAGALRQSHAGIAVSDESNNFSPACDAVLQADKFSLLPSFIRFAKDSKYIIIGSFIISILYNIVGLWFATRAELRPVIAAILMPASSLSIILFTTVATSVMANKRGLK